MDVQQTLIMEVQRELQIPRRHQAEVIIRTRSFKEHYVQSQLAITATNLNISNKTVLTDIKLTEATTMEVKAVRGGEVQAKTLVGRGTGRIVENKHGAQRAESQDHYNHQNNENNLDKKDVYGYIWSIDSSPFDLSLWDVLSVTAFDSGTKTNVRTCTSSLLEYKEPTGYYWRNKLQLIEPRSKLQCYSDWALLLIAPKSLQQMIQTQLLKKLLVAQAPDYMRLF